MRPQSRMYRHALLVFLMLPLGGCVLGPRVIDHTKDHIVLADGRKREIVHKEPPAYPLRLRAAGIEGTVTVRYRINPDGSVHGIEVLDSPHDELSELTVAAFSKWRFAPTDEWRVIMGTQKIRFSTH